MLNSTISELFSELEEMTSNMSQWIDVFGTWEGGPTIDALYDRFTGADHKICLWKDLIDFPEAYAVPNTMLTLVLPDECVIHKCTLLNEAYFEVTGDKFSLCLHIFPKDAR